jgi:hypothetical protein
MYYVECVIDFHVQIKVGEKVRNAHHSEKLFYRYVTGKLMRCASLLASLARTFLPQPFESKRMKIPVQSTNFQMMNSSSSLHTSVKISIDLLHAFHIDSIKSILTHSEEKH